MAGIVPSSGEDRTNTSYMDASGEPVAGRSIFLGATLEDGRENLHLVVLSEAKDLHLPKIRRAGRKVN